MKIEYLIIVETDQRVNNETKMEVLANIRNAMRSVDKSYPEMQFSIIRKVTEEDIMETFHAPETDSQTYEHCRYYDEAQGRHKCTHPLVKSKRCEGLCKHFWTKR